MTTFTALQALSEAASFYGDVKKVINGYACSVYREDMQAWDVTGVLSSDKTCARLRRNALIAEKALKLLGADTSNIDTSSFIWSGTTSNMLAQMAHHAGFEIAAQNEEA